MRLTKRQLKRIIREEYSRLKRRGLIRETKYSWMKTHKPGQGFPFTDAQWAATDQAEKDAYMDWAFGDDDDDDLRGDESDGPFDQELVDRRGLFLDEEYYLEGLANDEHAVFHMLQGEFSNASEEEIAEAMAEAGF